ncbi:hypothetical protein AB0J86_01520 [Micromonospora sp. NPDC049559]|uniref:hypothetical protein n=1 Tax=Micromonospora sp. NPDC049559 TaxID=3155923 RepID=UPI00342CE0C8
MKTSSKVTLSGAAVVLLLLVGAITAFVIFANSFATDPIEGWLDDPPTPSPAQTAAVEPGAPATAKPTSGMTQHP